MFGLFKKKTVEETVQVDDARKKAYVFLHEALRRTVVPHWRSKQFDLKRADHMMEVWVGLMMALKVFAEEYGMRGYAEGSCVDNAVKLSTQVGPQFRLELTEMLKKVQEAPDDHEGAIRLLSYCVWVGE